MFLKISAMKKLLKEAYKHNRLIIGHNETQPGLPGGYYITNGDNWIVWVGQNSMKKEFLAALIEVVGELPEMGKFYRDGAETGKLTDDDDETLSGTENKILEKFIIPARTKPGKKFNITNFILIQTYADARVLQSETGEITLLNESFVKTLNLGAIDEEAGECIPQGPIRIKETNWQSWDSGLCVFAVRERYCDDEKPAVSKALKLLETIDLNDKEI